MRRREPGGEDEGDEGFAPCETEDLRGWTVSPESSVRPSESSKSNEEVQVIPGGVIFSRVYIGR